MDNNKHFIISPINTSTNIGKYDIYHIGIKGILYRVSIGQLSDEMFDVVKTNEADKRSIDYFRR